MLSFPSALRIYLAGDKGEQKRQELFAISRSWALGTKPFKQAWVEAHTRLRSPQRLEPKETRQQARLLQWESRAEPCREFMGRTPRKAAAEPKSAAWKVPIGPRPHEKSTDVLQRTAGRQVEKPHMGALHGVSRYVGETLAVSRPEGKRLTLRLYARLKEFPVLRSPRNACAVANLALVRNALLPLLPDHPESPKRIRTSEKSPQRVSTPVHDFCKLPETWSNVRFRHDAKPESARPGPGRRN